MKIRLAMMLGLAAALMVPAMTGQASAVAGKCPVERVVYRMDGTDAVLRLRPDDHHDVFSDLGAVLTVSGKEWKLRLEESNGLPFDTFSVIDPSDPTKTVEKGGFRAYFFDKKVAPSGLPNTGKPAPAYIFTPELSYWFWYGEAIPGDRVGIPMKMWKPSGCE